jgi:hypothetical protein
VTSPYYAVCFYCGEWWEAERPSGLIPGTWASFATSGCKRCEEHGRPPCQCGCQRSGLCRGGTHGQLRWLINAGKSNASTQTPR